MDEGDVIVLANVAVRYVMGLLAESRYAAGVPDDFESDLRVAAAAVTIAAANLMVMAGGSLDEMKKNAEVVWDQIVEHHRKAKAEKPSA